MVSLCGSLEGEDLGFSLAEVLTLIFVKAFLLHALLFPHLQMKELEPMGGGKLWLNRRNLDYHLFVCLLYNKLYF